ncbi:MAG: hypothetical protein A2942_00015 [Candidatus Lloydbacteria bacterium RIFCSPLOWO2_01_FULL_50_20]|uniref:Uncharacterized protein n=1 Tax=Candidatus Lloydbacteria bacterium RIFCSPLOWO2_01_FULL_50_20 TaxID=1798665 RepID=A0A1G2DGR7_9BACT|nr:MAG: hypothetical protein A3C13_04005 [Candidatus Lloydbacteria bacterium RIFCSPHIGHO2_02_FULL_50_11]OGZ12050.1 MAG: hypothetical protein A2942_00015 [Candidatus Lloydbacteria bacterium RIFCSPLOWO2_01_FULL_50_20]
MAEDVSKEVGQSTERKLSPYEKMPRELQLQWEERYFNMFKLRQSLLDADSAITYAYVLWARFALLVAILLAIDPVRFPWRVDFVFGLSAFLVYYALIGFVRRQTERNFTEISAQHPDPNYHKSDEFKKKKPYHEEDDPPLAHFFFRMRPKLGIPRRGAAQKEVIIWQFVVVLCYVVNYSWYVVWRGETSGDISLLWMLQVTMTSGGILVLFKNAGFLVNTRHLLQGIQGLVGTVLGHSSTSVTIDGGDKRPCPEKKEGE